VFNWDTPRRRNMALIGFLMLSLVLHAAGFYVFQIVYPPALSLLPPPGRLSLVTSNSEEGRTVLRWLEAEDPALAASTLRPAEMKGVSLPMVEHVPLYLTREPVLRNAPPLIVDLSIPTSQPPAPVAVARPQPEQKSAAWPTTILFSKELQSLGSPALPALRFVASNNEAPQDVFFRIAVGDHGEILYCFPQSSSGDHDLDEQARKFLTLCRFSGRESIPKAFGASEGESRPNGSDLIWGTATIEWGNDVALPTAKAASAEATAAESSTTPTP
jgi:hypothetical protein